MFRLVFFIGLIVLGRNNMNKGLVMLMIIIFNVEGWNIY